MEISGEYTGGERRFGREFVTRELLPEFTDAHNTIQQQTGSLLISDNERRLRSDRMAAAQDLRMSLWRVATNSTTGIEELEANHIKLRTQQQWLVQTRLRVIHATNLDTLVERLLSQTETCVEKTDAYFQAHPDEHEMELAVRAVLPPLGAAVELLRDVVLVEDYPSDLVGELKWAIEKLSQGNDRQQQLQFLLRRSQVFLEVIAESDEKMSHTASPKSFHRQVIAENEKLHQSIVQLKRAL